MMGRLRSTVADRLADPGYRAVQLPFEESLRRRPSDVPGTLLRLRPYADNGGIGAGAGFWRSVHDVSTNFRGRNTSDHHAFEIWFDEGTIRFYLHAADGDAATTFRRRIANTYGDTEVLSIREQPVSPEIEPESYVAGARVHLRKHRYYPIRNHEAEGFEVDPYADLTGEMLSTEASSIVVQVLVRPAKRSWTDADRFRRNGVDDVAHGLRQGTSVGWLHPRRRPATEADERAAMRIEHVRGRPAFHVTIRVLAAAPAPGEAEARARGVASTFRKQYDSSVSQGFIDAPVSSRSTWLHARRLRTFLRDVADRRWRRDGPILTVDELAGVAHLPNESIDTPDVDWKRARRADRLPTEPQTGADTTEVQQANERSLESK